MYHGYGYPPYGAYPPPGSPVPSMGHDSQLYGLQHYQYPAPYYQRPTPNNVPSQVPSSQAEVSTSVSAGQLPVSGENANGATDGIANGKTNGNGKSQTSVRPSYNSLPTNSNGFFVRGIMPGGVPTSYPDHRFGHDGRRSPVAWLDGPMYSDGQPRPSTSVSVSVSSSTFPISNIPSARNQSIRPPGHLMVGLFFVSSLFISFNHMNNFSLLLTGFPSS